MNFFVLEQDSPLRRIGYQNKVTLFIVLICILVTISSFSLKGDLGENLEMLGYVSSFEVFDGGYGYLLTSCFLHVDILHLLLNMYWLFLLGTRLEEYFGFKKYVTFVVFSGFFSSLFELIGSDDMGIGASGIVYAMFGCMWVGRGKVESFKNVIDIKTINLFMIWLVLCIVLTVLEIFNIGNYAHAFGLIIGLLIAFKFIVKKYEKLSLSLLILLSCFSVSMLYICPWSVSWMSVQAYHHHHDKEYEEARFYYEKILWFDPNNE